MDTIAQKIAYVRSKLNLTQVDFAESINYSRSYVNDIESGRVKPSRGFLEALRSKYGISIDEILSDLGTQILIGMNARYLTSDKGFIYLYDFSESGIEAAWNKTLEFLEGKKFKILEGKNFKGRREFLEELLDLKENYHSQRINRDVFFQNTADYIFIVLRGFSGSSLKKEMWKWYIDIGRFIRGTLIVIDKPSYLEKHIDRLYPFAYPIHFKDSFGFAHPPK